VNTEQKDNRYLASMYLGTSKFLRRQWVVENAKLTLGPQRVRYSHEDPELRTLRTGTVQGWPLRLQPPETVNTCPSRSCACLSQCGAMPVSTVLFTYRYFHTHSGISMIQQLTICLLNLNWKKSCMYLLNYLST